MSSSNFKPLLAATLSDFEKLKFPVYGSPKLDGIRATVIGSKIVSRNLKPIPNNFVRACLDVSMYNNFDGELLVGSEVDSRAFNSTTSGIMSEQGSPNFKYYVFDDHTNPTDAFEKRLKSLEARVAYAFNPLLSIVPHTLISNLDELQALEQKFYKDGYEGLMIRDPKGVYKFGRSSEREGILIKMKRFFDDEAVIVEVYEQLENTNEAKKDALGRTKRSSAKANKIPKNTLGGFVLEKDGLRFKVGGGPGLTMQVRSELWAIKDQLIGQMLKYKFQKDGMVDLPRFTQYIGIRKD